MSWLLPFRRFMTEPQFVCALEFLAANSPSPIRDELILTLAALAGLRAHEITAVSLATLIEANGHVADQIIIPQHVTKYGTARVLPMPGRVREALIRFRSAFPDAERLGDLFEPGATKAVRDLLAATYAEIKYLDVVNPTARLMVRELTRLPAMATAPEPPKPPESRAGKAGPLRNADVLRAVKAIERAGLTVASTEIRQDGTIKFTHAPAEETPSTAYDKWKERRDARST